MPGVTHLIRNMKIKPETGDPNISFTNVLNLMDIYGKLVAIVHAVIPYEDENGQLSPRHVTQCFFSRGYVHTSLGFSIGIDFDKTLDIEEIKKVSGLLNIACMIPGLATSICNQIHLIATPSIIQENFEAQKCLYILFSSPVNIPRISESPGFIAFKTLKSLLNGNIIKVNGN